MSADRWAVEYLVKFSDGSEVSVKVPPFGTLSIKRGREVTFDVDVFHVAEANGPKLV